MLKGKGAEMAKTLIIKPYRIASWLELRFAYNPEILPELKLTAGRGGYQWLPNEKLWIIHKMRESAVTTLFLEHDYTIKSMSEPEPQPARPTNGKASNPYLEIFHSVSPELAHGVYRSLTQKLHPDVQGDLIAMQHLNIAWEQYSKERGKSW